MNIKTTIFLLILLALGAGGYFAIKRQQPAEAASPTIAFLDNDLTANKLTRIEIKQGERDVVLERSGPKAEWSLPGKWPVRDKEITQLLDTLTGLRSRFVPSPLPSDDELKTFGLDKNTLTVKLKLAGQDHTLLLGDQPGEVNRFSRATFLRLDDQKEVVRLAPGLISQLGVSQEYYQQRRLFPFERVAKEPDSSEKVEQLLARGIAVKAPDTSYDLVKTPERWELKEPITDRVDPEKLKSILAAFPDIWAERFIEIKGPRAEKLEEYGLKKPEIELTVTRASGTEVKLLVGKTSRMEIRKVEKPGMPQLGQPPKVDIVKEEYRYAKLGENDQVFEIKADKLKDIDVPVNMLRDPQLARFKADDVQRLEIKLGDQPIILVKDKDRWKLEKPLPIDAETSQVTELLTKLADLQTRDFLDKADPKSVGLAKPFAVIKLTVTETKTKDAKPQGEVPRALGVPPEPKSYTFDFGTSEKDKGKLYVKVEGWPRVNVLDDAVLKLIQRPALAYRTRRVIDLAAADLTRLDVHRTDGDFAFAHNAGTWRLTAPVDADVDSSKVSTLAGELARLEAVEFVADKPKDDELVKIYGLAKPALSVKVEASGKQAKTLLVGNKRGKDEYYARVDQGPIFVVKKALHDDLDRDSLAYRADKLWDLAAADISEIAIQKEDSEYRLRRIGGDWQVVAPFTAKAVGFLGDKLAGELANLKAQSFVTHLAKDLTPFGLAKPYLRVRILTIKDKDKKDSGKEHTLLVGRVKDADQSRFARIDGGSAIFILAAKFVADLDRPVYDLMEKTFLTMQTSQVQSVRSKGPIPFTLEKKKDAWQVIDSPAPPFAAEEDIVQNYLQAWANVRVEKIVAYGPKIDWAMYGLDKPGFGVIFTTKAGDKDAKPIEHTVAFGKEAAAGDRFARVDQNPEVLLLSAATVRELTKSYLDFVDPLVLKFARDSAVGLSRQMPGGDFEVAKKDDAWQLLKPDRPADAPTMDKLLDSLFRLRGLSVAAYPVKDLAPFGLDKPAATVTVKLTDAVGKTTEHIIRLGKAASDKDAVGHFALVDKGPAVVVLAPELSRILLSPTPNFGNHNLANLFGIDQVTIQRGLRRTTFLQETGTWVMVDPVRAEAESEDLTSLVRGLSRLRADEIVAEKADPKTYGLEKPQADIKLFAQGKIVLDLTVGAAEPGNSKSPRLYGKLAGKDLVFLLSPQISGTLKDEFRSRKPWESFDAAQVEKLSVQAADKSFTLIKQGADWQVQDKLDLKVNAKTVTDTLDTLARFKVLRYVVDAKADLQLYGLSPPVLKLEADLPSGKRVLLIGRAEGTTQRHYASVAGSDAVFLLDAADAQKLMRGLMAYTQESKDTK